MAFHYTTTLLTQHVKREPGIKGRIIIHKESTLVLAVKPIKPLSLQKTS